MTIPINYPEPARFKYKRLPAVEHGPRQYPPREERPKSRDFG